MGILLIIGIITFVITGGSLLLMKRYDKELEKKKTAMAEQFFREHPPVCKTCGGKLFSLESTTLLLRRHSWTENIEDTKDDKENDDNKAHRKHTLRYVTEEAKDCHITRKIICKSCGSVYETQEEDQFDIDDPEADDVETFTPPVIEEHTSEDFEEKVERTQEYERQLALDPQYVRISQKKSVQTG